MSKPNNTQIAKRYAQAFFDVVTPEARATVSDEFKQALIVLQDPQIKRTFTHPRTSMNRKSELIRLMNLSTALEHFLLLIVEKNRDQFLPHIEQEFAALVLKSQHITVAEIISAVELKEQTLKQLQLQLEQISGKTVQLSTSLDPKIGGGLIIKIDGKVIDGSIANSLQRFQRSLSS
jgi:F-type H+-transporting ATPase subunit delta